MKISSMIFELLRRYRRNDMTKPSVLILATFIFVVSCVSYVLRMQMLSLGLHQTVRRREVGRVSE
jgi:hypothetical protein